MFVILLVISSYAFADSNATVEFKSNTDMSKWIKNNKNLKWAIAVSTKPITKIEIGSDGKKYNRPAIKLSKAGPFLLMKGIRTSETKKFKVKPGKYNWLILIDHNGDGIMDSYLGTVEKMIKLKGFEFKAGGYYKVTVKADSEVEFTVRKK